jgi:tetratricopeptide (TPR) repeat protein
MRTNKIDPASPWNGAGLLPIVAWLMVLILAVIAYWPGLQGPFLLDDFGTLPALGDYGGVVDWETFKLFVLGGTSGPTGRPLSLLTFLADAGNWPAESLPFKRTNLLIHLATGVMLGMLTTLVLKFVNIDKRRVPWIALVSAAVWILHPFLVSTTLYIVQRMAQLSALFVFSGLTLYLYGRLQTAVDSRRGYAVMSAAIGIFTLLALLSKENGILLPVLVGVLELTVVASQAGRFPALNRAWASVFIVAPATVVGLYLVAQFFQDDFLEVIPPRDFSMYERLLTQGRVLADYLQNWFLPKLYTTGVFQDHFIKSTGLFQPVTTIAGLALHLFALAFAFMKRRQFPLVSLAILFFYGSHLLESTTVNLELYFEHRNYMAAAFLFLPLIEFLGRKLNQRSFVLASVALVMLVGGFTRYSAHVWRSLPSMIESSALKAPTSARAQSQYAKLLFYHQRHDAAMAVIDNAIATIPGDDPLLLMNRLYFRCNRNVLDSSDYEAVAERLATLPFDTRATKPYNQFAQEVAIGSCPNIRTAQLEALFTRMLDVPHNGNEQSLEYSHIQFLIGYMRMHARRPDSALSAFEKSLDAKPDPAHAMAMAELLASGGYGEQALRLAARARSLLDGGTANNPRPSHGIKRSDIDGFQEQIRRSLGAEGAT